MDVAISLCSRSCEETGLTSLALEVTWSRDLETAAEQMLCRPAAQASSGPLAPFVICEAALRQRLRTLVLPSEGSRGQEFHLKDLSEETETKPTQPLPRLLRSQDKAATGAVFPD